MKMRRCHWVPNVSQAVVLGACLFWGRAEAAPPLTLEEVREAVKNELASIRSIYVAHSVTRPVTAGGKTSQHVWAQQGREVVFRTDYTDEYVGHWMSFDGKRAYHLGYDKDRKPKLLRLTNERPDVFSACRFPKLLGWQIGQGGGSMVDALARPDVEMEGPSEDGIYVVEVRNFTSEPDPTVLNVTLDVDSRHDYLPRRVRYVGVASPSWEFAYEVDEFALVRDASDGKERWFPMKGRYIQGTPERGREEFPIVATEVKINEVLKHAEFIPDVPDGTLVTDETGSKSKSYLFDSSVAQAERLTLDDLRAVVADQLSSIRSLHVAHSIVRPKTAGGQTSEHVWARQDAQVLFRTDYTDEYVGHWASYDGTRAYHLGYNIDREPSLLDLRDGTPDLYLATKFPKLLGWEIGQGGSSISEALSARNVEMNGPNENGVYVVEIPNFTSQPNPTVLNVTVEFDSRHDYLPRRIGFYGVNVPTWKFAYEVEEFERVKDAATGNERWFPMRGRYVQDTPERGNEVFAIIIKEVRLNERLPDSVFVPEMPKGLKVVDNTEKGHGRFYIVGGLESTDEYLNGLAGSAMKELGGRNRTRLLLVIGVFLLLVGTGVFLAVRSKRTA